MIFEEDITLDEVKCSGLKLMYLCIKALGVLYRGKPIKLFENVQTWPLKDLKNKLTRCCFFKLNKHRTRWILQMPLKYITFTEISEYMPGYCLQSLGSAGENSCSAWPEF